MLFRSKGFRDTYEPITQTFPKIKTYEVLVDVNPEIPEAYNIKTFPATMFINLKNKAKTIEGFISPHDAMKDVRDFLL